MSLLGWLVCLHCKVIDGYIVQCFLMYMTLRLCILAIFENAFTGHIAYRLDLVGVCDVPYCTIFRFVCCIHLVLSSIIASHLVTSPISLLRPPTHLAYSPHTSLYTQNNGRRPLPPHPTPPSTTTPIITKTLTHNTTNHNKIYHKFTIHVIVTSTSTDIHTTTTTTATTEYKQYTYIKRK